MILNIRNGRNTTCTYGLQIQKYVPEKNKKELKFIILIFLICFFTF